MQDPSYKREKKERKRAEDFIDDLYKDIERQHEREATHDPDEKD